MISKISNLKLILGLVLLGLVYLVVAYLDSSKSAELEKQLVSIDTSKVTQITIQSPDQTVNLYKENQGWQVELSTEKKVAAKTDKVTTLLDQLLDISTDRLAAKEESKWGDYQVDSTGTSLKIHEGDQLTLDMMVGQSGSTSYLRLADEDEVYASDGFRGLRTSDQINHFRDNTFIRMNTDSLESIAFNYPGDSSFQVINNNGTWNLDDGAQADSAKTAQYINKLKLKYNDDFAGQDGSSVGPQIAEIVISSKNQPQISIKAHGDVADSVIYQSSVNEESFFKDKQIGEDYFISKSDLMPSPE